MLFHLGKVEALSLQFLVTVQGNLDFKNSLIKSTKKAQNITFLNSKVLH